VDKIKKKKIDVYITTDDKEFNSKEEAEVHQKKLEFEEWYDDNTLYSQIGQPVEADDVLNWLITNKKDIGKVIK
jgi:hypothetical protein